MAPQRPPLLLPQPISVAMKKLLLANQLQTTEYLSPMNPEVLCQWVWPESCALLGMVLLLAITTTHCLRNKNLPRPHLISATVLQKEFTTVAILPDSMSKVNWNIWGAQIRK